MLSLLRLVAARHLRDSRGRTLLTLLGICVGVSAVVGITALNGAVLDAFNTMVASISRGSDLQVSSGEVGVPDEMLEKVRAVPGVTSASPLLENTVMDPATGDRILVLGIDFLGHDPFRGLAEKEGGKNIVDDEMAFLNNPRAVLVAGPYAQAHALKKGDVVKLLTASGPADFEIAGLLAPTGAAKAFGGSVGIMGMDAAQLMFGKENRYDRIDVEVDVTVGADAVRERIRAATGGGMVVDRPNDRGQRISRMVFALQTALQLASGVALLVGIFVVFNTMAIAVMQRRRELATLRALGMPRAQVVALVAGEAALLGILGGLAGVLLGRLLAELALQSVADAISAIYVEIKPSGAQVPAWLAVTGFLMGVVTAVVGAARPAADAAGVSPVMVLAGRATSLRPPRHPALMALAGGLTLTSALFVATLPAWNDIPVAGYVAAFLVLVGTALCAPLVLSGLRAATEPVMRALGSVTGQLACGNLTRDLSRASVTSVALMFGLALSIGVGALVGSFKSTMDQWLVTSVPSDMFLSVGGGLADQKNIPVKVEVGAGLADVPGVEAVFHVRMAQLPFEDLTLQVLSLETDVYMRRAKLMVRDGPSVITGQMLRSTGGVTISENLSSKKHLHAGDVLVLGTPKGPRRFPILAVAVDFTSDQGFVMMDRSTYTEAFGDTLADMFQLFLKPGTDVEATRRVLAQQFGPRGLTVTTNGEFRAYVGALVDNAFAVTGAIQLVAVLIALLGIINTLLAAVLDRTREIGVLRAVGALRSQVNAVMVVEAILLGLGAAVMSVVAGSAFGHIFTAVINFQSTGWSLPFVFPWGTAGQAALLSVGVAAIASLVPARRAGHLDVRDALSVE
ncbi:MAG: ABC transporter permease [Deltaproteobacteria bacterium]|nr:ABC transporter permease [Deltaproteobacteria bacterium]